MVTSAQSRCTYHCSSGIVFVDMIEYRIGSAGLHTSEVCLVVSVFIFQRTVDLIDTLTSTICSYNTLLCIVIPRSTIKVDTVKVTGLKAVVDISEVYNQGWHGPCTVLQYRDRELKRHTILT